MQLILDQICKSFGTKEVLKNASFTFEQGKIYGLLGRNGSGKTTLIKLLNGLLCPTEGIVLIDGYAPGVETKAVVSYLPDRMYFADWMKTRDLLSFFQDFYPDFDRKKAEDMCASLKIQPGDRIKSMSKGTKEKLQLCLAMSRQSYLYLLDEPIAGVDPAARDFILNTILTNYNPEATVLISTHLIGDVERVLDEVVFLQQGRVLGHEAVDDIRAREGKSVDDVFRDMFRANPQGGDYYAG